MCMQHKSYSRFALRVGLWFVGIYALCFVWPWIRGLNVELSALHYQMWQIAFFGFTGFNLGSFIVGLMQVFIWGLIAAGLWKLAGFCCGCERDKVQTAESHGGHCGH